jgi:hypothetical protein
LNRFVDFESFQTKNTNPLLGEIGSLITEISSLSDGELSSEVFSNTSLSEIAKRYVTYCLQIYEWSRAKDKSTVLKKILGKMKRIASMFSIGLNPNEFLIHGHGHKMMIDQNNRIVDAGCWIGDSGSFVSINDGDVSGSRWPKR